MKTVKNIFYVLLSIVLIFILSKYSDFDDKDLFSDIITFLSITIGFGITSLTIIATSTFSNSLYKTEDSSNNSQTLLHVIVYKFRNAIVLFILTIAFTFISLFLSQNCICCSNFTNSIIVILKGTVWYLTIISFVVFVKLILMFSRFVIKSGQSSR